MASLKHVFLENPLTLYVILAAAEGIVVIVWYCLRTRRSALALLAAPVLGIAVGLTAYFVKTDLERIDIALKTISRSVEDGDLNAAAEYLDPACRALLPGGRTIDREAILRIGRRAVRRYRVSAFRLLEKQIEIDAPEATTRLETLVVLGTGESTRMGWRLNWVKRKSGWRVVQVNILHPTGLANWNF